MNNFSTFEKNNVKIIENIVNRHSHDNRSFCKKSLDICYYTEEINGNIHIFKNKSKKNLEKHLIKCLNQFIKDYRSLDKIALLNMTFCMLTLYDFQGWQEKDGFNFGIERTKISPDLSLFNISTYKGGILFDSKNNKILKFHEVRRIF